MINKLENKAIIIFLLNKLGHCGFFLTFITSPVGLVEEELGALGGLRGREVINGMWKKKKQ